MKSKNLKQIAVSNQNYDALKSLGKAGDSFNDVIEKVLKQIQSSSQERQFNKKTSQTAALGVGDSVQRSMTAKPVITEESDSAYV
ncbi:MAG TPA: hypothetical protein VE076_13035 [Nitrososphaeraceae archaeon]|jgi:predicted CopG family antitoxin|nr:hypothetical protein [Nitrososphaeraceae archaeon]